MRIAKSLLAWSACLLAVPLYGADTPQKTARKSDDSRTAASRTESDNPLEQALNLAEESRKALEDVKDYTAVFSKRELLNGRLLSQTMDLKIREKPFSVYLKFVEPHAGREVIYVDGANQNKLLVHEEGVKAIAGTVSLSPTSADAMAENKYPLTRLGMRKLLEAITTQWEEDLKHDDTKVKFFPNAKLADAQCTAIETTHTEQKPEYKFKMTRLFLDKETKLPIRVEQYGWPTQADQKPPLAEEYTYSKLKVNAGLTDEDFSTKNPKYRY
jgi:hypothetical protein